MPHAAVITAPAAPAKNSKPIPLNGPMLNFIYLMMESLAKNQQVMANQQYIDAQAAEKAVSMESTIYEYWYGPGGPLARAAEKTSSNQAKEAQYQTEYNLIASKAQSATTQSNSLVDSAQSIVGEDGTNMQMKAQEIQGFNSIEAAVSQYLGHVNA